MLPKLACPPGLSWGQMRLQGKASFIHSLQCTDRAWQCVLQRVWSLLWLGQLAGLERSWGASRQRQSFLICSGRMSGQPIGQVAPQVYLGHDGRMKLWVKITTGMSGRAVGHEGGRAPSRPRGWDHCPLQLWQASGTRSPRADSPGPCPGPDQLLSLCPRRRRGTRGGRRRKHQLLPVRRRPSRPWWRMRRWRRQA